MDETKVSVRAGVVVLIIVGLLLCPVATAGLTPLSVGLAQIGSTPHGSSLTPAPEGRTIGPTV